METRTSVLFAPFRLDLETEQLWREEQTIALRPKTFAVLRYLVEQAGQLVTKDEFLDAVWAGTVVSDTVLKSCIRELREALGDDVQAPQYIATVHRRGYRFIGLLSPLPSQSTVPTATVHRPRGEEERKLTRKLAAILSADVHGYSRLMGADELGTIRTLTIYRAVMTELIAQHRGRVVDAPGDNVLAEFASAVDALHCAVALQQALGEKNAALPAERQMRFRLGLNVGDVVVEGERIYGEGVNIAARLEGLAEPGGLCISGTVYDQVKTKVALAYEYLGERGVKNIAEPVRVYRVLASLPTAPPVVSPQLSVASHQKTGGSNAQLGTGNWPLTTPLVGRDAELAQLQAWLEKALRGERQLVFVTGEPGIGKTTLVEAFLRGIGGQGAGVGSFPLQQPTPKPQHPTPFFWIGRGQCVEQYGAGEAYMPILEALGRLCREPGGERLIALLHQHAPTWLVQMPTLLNSTDLEMLQRKTQHATRERMLREMAEAVDVLTAEQPLIVWLEDLHWSDPSTLELLALLARRRELARFLVIGTYRPVDVIVSEHPLKAVKQELQLHGQCQEVAVRLLSEEAVGKYLTARFEADRGARHAVRLQQLAHTIHQRTEGNPLFMVNIVEELSAQGKIDSTAVELITPATIREMIERHLERLSPAEQRILEVASVAGIEFSTAAVAAGTEITVDEVEQQCAALARRGQFLRSDGQDEWPDGTIATRYSFLHALYQEVTYERVPVGWRTRLHQRIGERYEAAYGKRVSEIAAELAVHFKRGQDYSRAVRYLRQAGQNAARRSAHQEAITLLTKGLELLNTFPDTPERARQELRLLRLLGPALVALRGYTAPEVEQTYARAFALCQQDGRPHQLLQVLPIFRVFSLARGEAGKAREVAEQVLQLAQQVSTPTALLAAHYGLGESLFHLGEFTAAREHLEQTWRLYNPQEHNPYVTLDWGDSGVWCLSHLAATLWMLGYPDQAWQRIDESLALAKELAHPFSLVFAVAEAGALHLLHQEWQHVRERAEEVMQLATEHGFPFLVAHGTALRGLALVAQGQGEDGIAQIQQSLASFRAMGTEMSRVDGLPWLAEAYGKVGQVEEGLTVLAEALAIVKKNGERWWGAELYRLKGELLLNAERGMRNAERKTKKKG